MMKKIFSKTILLCFAFFGFSQNTLLRYNGSGSYVYIERTDLRRYDNGKYVGLVSREVRSSIAPVSSPEGGNANDRYYEGSFFVDESTKRNALEVKEGLSDAIPSSFRISPEGEQTMIVDNGYPSFRSFPAFTTQRIGSGDKWQAKAERTVDPLNKGIFTKMPILVEYTYLRDEKLNNEDVYVFSAEWATRYGISYWDFGGDKELKSAQGSHRATMYVSKKSGNALVVRDSVDETFIYTDGNQYSFKGTISMFTEYPPAYDKSKIIPALQRVASLSAEELKKIIEEPTEERKTNFEETPSGKNEYSEAPSKPKEEKKAKDTTESKVSELKDEEKNVVVEKTEMGIRLTMQNLNFKPDSAELLPGESERLDSIALLLKEVPDQMFLVEGHTASTGNAKGEMNLSVERANAIASSLIERGVPSDKFICKGSGSTKPIADNSTPSGMAKNRRVEITILD